MKETIQKRIDQQKKRLRYLKHASQGPKLWFAGRAQGKAETILGEIVFLASLLKRTRATTAPASPKGKG